MVYKLSQYPNAQGSIRVTLFGILILLTALNSPNAAVPISVIPSFTTMVFTSAYGSIRRARFVPQTVPSVYAPYFGGYSSWKRTSSSNTPDYEDDYVAALMSEAERSGLYAGIVEEMMQDGFTLEEIEDFIYCGSCYQ